MVNKEQLIKGILTYADKEIIPQLPTAGKWGLGTIILLSQNKVSDIISSMVTNQYIQSIGIIDCDGLIDVDILSNALIQTANRYGRCEITIPFIGSLTFSSKDIEMLKDYVIGGTNDD